MKYEVLAIEAHLNEELGERNWDINWWHKTEWPIEVETDDDIIRVLIEDGYLQNIDHSLVTVEEFCEGRLRVSETHSGEPLYDLVEMKGSHTAPLELTDIILAELPWQKLSQSQTASGYGSKLTTRYKAKYNGRYYRVYARCYSNTSSTFILVKGFKIWVDISQAPLYDLVLRGG
jgi:hypothetical protein